jgi:glycosyltransferase involved in cell wall biosynthesis
MRTGVQRAVVRYLARRADPVFSTLEDEVAEVFHGVVPSPRFLPAGSNIPVGIQLRQPHRDFVISVFAFSNRRDETLLVADVANRVRAEIGPIRCTIVGRGALEAEGLLRPRLRDVHLSVAGVIDAREVAETLSSSDALLFVRGDASSRRGSIVAAICLGVPVVASEGAETGPSIRSAGITLFPRGDVQAAADALTRLGTDAVYAAEQRAKQRTACASMFSWSAIASRVKDAL